MVAGAAAASLSAVWLSLLWSVLINYGAAQVTVALARALPAATSAMSVMAVPLVGTLSAPLIVGEWPGWHDLAAMVCVVVWHGVAAAQPIATKSKLIEYPAGLTPCFTKIQRAPGTGAPALQAASL